MSSADCGCPAVLSIVAGVNFGLGGVAFQTMLCNHMASPDLIGINSGASAAAVFAIVVLSLDGPAVSIVAVIAGLWVTIAIYGLSFRAEWPEPGSSSWALRLGDA